MDWPHGQENRSADDRLQGVVKIRRCFPPIPDQFCMLINIRGLCRRPRAVRLSTRESAVAPHKGQRPAEWLCLGTPVGAGGVL